MTLTGKGYYIWKVKNCEKGDPDRIAALAREADLSHVLIKIADGPFPYNVDMKNGFDYARPAIKKLQAQNISVWGWQYVYGGAPNQEAEIAVTRALELGVNGFVINAETEYSSIFKAKAASRYMDILRSNLGSMPLALSSYRFPTYHAQFPWVNFLERCDYNMPQVYWMHTHNNSAEQLQRCVNEFKNIHPYRPIIPTGPTFKEFGWKPTEEEMTRFLDAARKLNLSAVNFWNWESARSYMPEFWDLVRNYRYDSTPQIVSLPKHLIDALNSKDPDKVIKFYDTNAIHINHETALQGKEAIREWTASLLKDFTDGYFSLIGEVHENNIHNFQWEATNKAGARLEGRDTIGVSNDKISYQYSSIKQTENTL